MSIKELFPQPLTNENFQLKEFVKKPLIVHDNLPVYKVLEQFRKSKQHNALIVDEYGTTQGLIAMDDIVDALIGNAPEYNQEDYQIFQREENSWLADGQYPFFEFLNYFELSENEVEGGNFNTLAGFLLFHMHHIPVTGERLKWNDFTFEIMDMDGQRIDKVLIMKNE